MRCAAGLFVMGLAALSTGCVERLIVERDSGGSGSDSATSSGSSTGPISRESASSSSDVSTTEPAECTGPADCPDNATCFEGVCVGSGTLRISLSWGYVSDLDLHVQTPTGTHISFENPNAGGGILDVDDCVGGDCIDNGGTHVENIYFPMQPPLGEYRIWVYNFDGLNGGPFEIEVSGAAETTFSGNLPASNVESQVFTFEI